VCTRKGEEGGPWSKKNDASGDVCCEPLGGKDLAWLPGKWGFGRQVVLSRARRKGENLPPFQLFNLGGKRENLLSAPRKNASASARTRVSATSSTPLKYGKGVGKGFSHRGKGEGACCSASSFFRGKKNIIALGTRIANRAIIIRDAVISRR